MEPGTVITGNKGDSTRSDCQVILKLTNSGGININLESKVKVLYGRDILSQVHEILQFYDITDAQVDIFDSGALPFVISARLEAAIHRLTKNRKEFILPVLPANSYYTERDRIRISRLYLPGNTPSLMLNAGIHHPDAIILDLEDSVSPEKKEEARYLVRNALCQVNFYGVERMVRINQYPEGLDDLAFVVPYSVHVLLLPKIEGPAQVKEIEKAIGKVQETYNAFSPVYLMPIIETAKGVENAYDIAVSSEMTVAMAIGLEDYTADLGVTRSQTATESFYARTRIVNACKAAGIQPIDSVFSDVTDMENLAATAKISKSLGFEGMGCIHPRQIKIIRENFLPEQEEIEKARIIILAFEEARLNGRGVVAVGSKMIDPPVVKRAQLTLDKAIRFNLLSPEWE